MLKLGIRTGLLRYLLSHTTPITVVAVPVACLFILCWRDVLDVRNAWVSLFIVVHSLLIVRSLGRFDRGSFAFLHTRGFSSDCIWAHKMLASLLAVLVVWIPVALIVSTPIRSALQDVTFNPNFPIMAQREQFMPLVWLVEYCVTIPLFHYSWIRRAQPVRGSMGGAFTAAGVIGAVCILVSEAYRHPWFNWLALVGVVVMACVLAASRKLHRRLEVRS